MRGLDGFDFRGKVVLVRADLNSDVRVLRVGSRKSEVGRVIESERIRASSETIRELKRKGARVVVVSHQGRPTKQVAGRRSQVGGDFVSLKSHARFLNKYVRIKFVDDVCGTKAIVAIKNLKNGEAVLLDNVRFVEDEFLPEKGKRNELYKLVGVADVFVNDAFSVCHRKQASVVLFPKYLFSFAGRLLEKEVRALREVAGRRSQVAGRRSLFILGGAKPEDNMRLLAAAGRRSQVAGRKKILACGLFGQTCLIAKGNDLGAQNKYLKKVVKDFFEIVGKLGKLILGKKFNHRLTWTNTDYFELNGGGEILMPEDFAVKVGGRRVERLLDEFPCDDEIFDIGSKTIEKYVGEIRKAKVVFMKGPAGFSADRKFAKGTVALLRAIGKSKGFSLIGGGHLNDTIKKYKLSGFGHISLSGGALVAYLAGEKLPGLSALEVVGGRFKIG